MLPNDTKQYLSTFQPKQGQWLLCAPRSAQGEGEAQHAARDLIEDLDPDWLVLTGIACAVPSMDFTLGDVVLVNRLHDFTIEAQREDLAVMRSGVRAPSAPPIQSTMNSHDVSALVPCPVS